MSGFWNRQQAPVCRVDDYKFFLGNAIPNILTDVFLMALPLPYIWRLNRPTSQKVALGGIFVLGGLFVILCTQNQLTLANLGSVIIVSIVRLVALVDVDLHSPDLDWNFAPIGVWTETESNIAIVCGKATSDCHNLLGF